MTAELGLRQRCCDGISESWPAFLQARRQHLLQGQRFGRVPERATEEILRELFTSVLDWPPEHVNWQVQRADIVLTSPGVKWLVVEAKRPGKLTWNEQAVHAALGQARRYAAEQHVRCVAVSDGDMLYAADVVHGGLRPRLLVSLAGDPAPEELWWISMHGIYRDRPDGERNGYRPLPVTPEPERAGADAPSAEILHPRYQRPARCFGYVGDASKPTTWKLPYLEPDGSVDVRRLPAAISAVLKSYRGVRVKGIPEAAMPDVLVRLARAAVITQRLPRTPPDGPTDGYGLLACTLQQEGRFEDVWRSGSESQPDGPDSNRAPCSQT